MNENTHFETPKSLVEELEAKYGDSYPSGSLLANTARGAIQEFSKYRARRDNAEQVKLFFDEFVERVKRRREESDRDDEMKLEGVSDEIRKKSEEMLAKNRARRSSPEDEAIAIIRQALASPYVSASRADYDLWQGAVPGLAEEEDADV